MNSVQLIGRATHDPQASTTANGATKTTFRLAVDRIGDGADFVTVKTWNRVAKDLRPLPHAGTSRCDRRTPATRRVD